ncbi:MAG: outer membrane assembly protein, partial [Tannerellaceae bacterium]|nr:outer membrane assembly protein [Tannerellaceae bacterium]
MKRKKKIVIAIAVALVTLLVVFPAAVFGYLNWKVFPPGKLTPLVVNEVNKMINGRLACERIELTFFETYPHLGIRFTNGQLISHAIQDSLHSGHEAHSGADSLLCFTQATVSLRPLDYLFKGIVTIGEIVVENPFLYGFVDDGGVANWDIFVSGKDSTAVGDSSSALPPIDLQKVRIVDGRFIYDDHQTGLYAEVGGFFFQLSGSLTTEGNTLDIETGSSSILFRSQAYTLNNKLALRLKSRIVLTDGFNTVTLQGAELMVNDLPFTADGAMTNLPERRSLGVNLEMGLKASDMNELLGFIPDAYLKDREKMVAAGSVTMEGNIYGEIDGSVVPTVDLCLKIAGGSFFMAGVKQGIEALEMDMDLHLNGAEPELSYITLEDLTLKGLNTSLDVKGTATGLMHSPAIDACMKGQIDFTRLGEEFLNPDTLLVRGKMDVDIDASFLLDDLVNGRYNRIKASGKLDIDTLRAYSHPYEVDVFVANAHLAIDSVKATSAYIAGNDLLQATLTVDSMQVKYKEGIDTNISWLEASAKTSPVMDTTAVIPLTTHIRVKQLKTLLPDSVWLVAG